MTILAMIRPRLAKPQYLSSRTYDNTPLHLVIVPNPKLIMSKPFNSNPRVVASLHIPSHFNRYRATVGPDDCDDHTRRQTI